MVKKGYLLVIVIVIIALATITVIVKKPKPDKEYFQSGLIQYSKSEASIQSMPDFTQLSPEKKEEYRKTVISSVNPSVKSYQAIIDNYPESRWADDAQFCIATAYHFTGNIDKAIEAYRKLITDYPEAKLEPQTMMDKDLLALPETIPSLHALAQEQIAGIYYRLKRNYPQALIEYNKVIDNYPQDKRATLMAAFDIERYSSEVKNYEPAIKAYQKLLKTRVNKPKDIAYFEKKIKELKAKQAALTKQS